MKVQSYHKIVYDKIDNSFWTNLFYIKEFRPTWLAKLYLKGHILKFLLTKTQHFQKLKKKKREK